MLEDIAWEEFGDNGDLIVPHTGGGGGDEQAFGSDSCKRPRYELSCADRNAGRKGSSNNIIQRKKETGFRAVKEEKESMLERGAWSHPSRGPSASQDGDSNRRTSCSTSDEDRTSNQCTKSSNMDSLNRELCATDPVLGDRATGVDNNLFSYQLNNASNNENGLGFFSDDLHDKESNELLYYGWPEIENFEDVDRMFRSCDSTFGLEIDKDDELGWFPSPHAIEGSDDVLKSSFNFPAYDPRAVSNGGEHQDIYGLNNSGVLTDETDQKLKPASLKKSPQKSPNGSHAFMNYSFDNGSGAIPSIDNGSQVQLHVSQGKEPESATGIRKEQYAEDGDSFVHLDDLKPVVESKHSLSLQGNFGVGTHKKLESRHQTCSQMPTALLSSIDNHPSNLASPRSSTIKSEDSGLPSVSPRESSYGSNQAQSVETSLDVSFKNPTVTGHKKKERSHQCRLSSEVQKGKSMVERADSNSASAQKQVPNFEHEVEGQSEVNGSDMGMPGELDSFNLQDSSCVSSVLDEVSIEASSFRQLQRVMQQLDIRTKLCIRDSLYRLARSAEQRHKCVNQTIGGRDDTDASGAAVSDETNKSTGYMDMETDTNPIDRSIAHLLFHRPSDPTATGVHEAGTAKSHTMVQAAKNGPMMAEKLISQDTTSANNEAGEQ